MHLYKNFKVSHFIIQHILCLYDAALTEDAVYEIELRDTDTKAKMMPEVNIEQVNVKNKDSLKVQQAYVCTQKNLVCTLL